MSVRQVLRDFWAGHTTRDHEALAKVVADDLVWTVVGRTSPVAARFEGREAYFGLLKMLDETFVPGSVSMDLLGLYADEEESAGVIHIHEQATLHNGNSVDQEIVDVITIRNNQIVEVREVMDLAEVNLGFGFETKFNTEEENHG